MDAYVGKFFRILPRSVVMSRTSKPLDLKYASASLDEMDGEGISTEEALDVKPSLLPVKMM